MSNQNGVQYELPNHLILRICGDDFSLFDMHGDNVNLKKLTPKKKKLLHCLLDSANSLVTYDKIYQAYSGDKTAHDVDASLITKMLWGIDDRITDCIENTAKKGYTISVCKSTPVIVDTSLHASSDVPQPHLALPYNISNNVMYGSRISELAGDYIGFYLDRKGSGSLFGVYLHIDNCGSLESPDMRAHAILGIQNDDVLFGKDIAEVFSVKKNDYSLEFAQFREHLACADKDCFIGVGAIIPHKAIIEITFGAITDEEWHIFVDLQGYLADTRTRQNDTDNYRGGLGLAFAFWSEFGDTCFRFAFVRNSLYSSSLSLRNQSIRDKLRMTAYGQGLDWKPIKLSSRLDKAWYNWFMKEYQTYNVLLSE